MVKRAREEHAIEPVKKRLRLQQYTEESGFPNPEDAAAFILVVKEKFSDNKEKYAEFLSVMKAYKLRPERDVFVKRLRELFKGHPSLIRGLNVFLPKGHERKVSWAEFLTTKEEGQFLEFAKTFKFQNDRNASEKFKKILDMIVMGNKSNHEIHQEVKALFSNHKDLLYEFTHILSLSIQSTRAHHTQASASLSSGPSYVLASTKQSQESMIQSDKSVTSHNSLEQNFQSDLIKDDEKRYVVVNDGHKTKIEEERNHGEDGKWKTQVDRGNKRSASTGEREVDFIDVPPFKNKMHSSDDLITSQVVIEHESTAEKVEKERNHKGDGKWEIQLDRGDKRSASDVEREVNFIDEHNFKTKMHCSDDMIINQRLIKHESTTENSLQDPPTDNKGTLTNRREDSGCNRVLKKENEKSTEQDQGQDRNGDKDHHHKLRYMSKRNIFPCSSKQKFMEKPIWELDLSDCEHCTPSYCLRPQNYPKPITSYRTDDAAKVLNDKWISRSATSSTEDYYKHMQWNQYETTLFYCECDRYELDMLIESIADTIKHIEELLEKMDNNTIWSHVHVQIGEHLTAMNLGCIERLYDGHGLDVIHQLQKNPGHCILRILKRLHQKQDDLSKQRTKLDKIWANIYAKNYQKSFDH